MGSDAGTGCLPLGMTSVSALPHRATPEGCRPLQKRCVLFEVVCGDGKRPFGPLFIGAVECPCPPVVELLPRFVALLQRPYPCRNRAAVGVYFCRLNKEVLVKSDSLFSAQSSDVEEEANLCLALLMGYNATIYDDGDKEQKKQMVLNRICLVLEQLPASLLKVRLLTYCYGEIYEEVLLQEAHAIIEGWNRDELTLEQTEIIEELKNIEENPYPFEEVE